MRQPLLPPPHLASIPSLGPSGSVWAPDSALPMGSQARVRGRSRLQGLRLLVCAHAGRRRVWAGPGAHTPPPDGRELRKSEPPPSSPPRRPCPVLPRCPHPRHPTSSVAPHPPVLRWPFVLPLCSQLMIYSREKIIQRSRHADKETSSLLHSSPFPRDFHLERLCYIHRGSGPNRIHPKLTCRRPDPAPHTVAVFRDRAFEEVTKVK